MRSFRFKIVSIFFLLVLLFLGFLVIATNNDRLANQYGISRYAPQFIPAQQVKPWKESFVNPDSSIMVYYNVAKIEAVEDKSFLFRKYTTITLRPKGEEDFISQTFPIDISNDLVSTGTYRIHPSELKNYLGKQIGLNILYDNYKLKSYSFFNVKAWEILNIF